MASEPCAWVANGCPDPATIRVTVWPLDPTGDALDEFAACHAHATEYAWPWRKP